MNMAGQKYRHHERRIWGQRIPAGMSQGCTASRAEQPLGRCAALSRNGRYRYVQRGRFKWAAVTNGPRQVELEANLFSIR
ncbi:uncharacterized protein TRIVIDRAFT_110989 [Trichoderma virens Gv29-8]|uniref:Uncharacterized protein n=1 Tax=Hypocrea virens (strain Gv29-8 / FGSC 10586) TaxID=413071 RepID=G9MEB3_HYPVG|nr:uncharacterized protein TRIVIDRAFT_110989 [Trichoderma virens Gv29-8]EHK27405.1 hypothetical protein TRIVIDRAFT_110989 [Trichoderma virens Gv29-8]